MDKNAEKDSFEDLLLLTYHHSFGLQTTLCNTVHIINATYIVKLFLILSHICYNYIFMVMMEFISILSYWVHLLSLSLPLAFAPELWEHNVACKAQ